MYRKRKKIAASKQVRDLRHIISCNGHKFYVKIVNFLLLLLFFHPSVSEPFSPLDGKLNWIPPYGLVTGAIERGVFVDLTLGFVLTTDEPHLIHICIVPIS
jgi:hypothetical protein